MRDSWPIAIAALLVVAAVGFGLGASVLTRRPQPTPVVLTFTPAPTTPRPSPTTDPAVFRQHLSGGCATDDDVWVISDGGTLIRYDGKNWEQVDATLRSLVQADCASRQMIAVGPAGAVLLVDEDAKTVSAIFLGMDDFYGISLMPEGALVSGQQGAVQLLSNGAWQPYAAGIDEDLLAIRGFSLGSAWAVGSAGMSYRLEAAGWRQIDTGTTAALRALAATTATDLIAVGDAGTVLRSDGKTWHAVTSGVDGALRGAILAPAMWIVGDGGVVLTGDPLRRVGLGTDCDLRTVFAHGADVWIVGSTGARGGVWRLSDGAVAEKWGSC